MILRQPLIQRRRQQQHLASSRGESHPPALSEPCVNLSIHTAPITQSVTASPAASGRTVLGRTVRS
jgi:hypothetical protein